MVENFQQTERDLILEVEVYKVEAICPCCQNVSHNLHQNHWEPGEGFTNQWSDGNAQS